MVGQDALFETEERRSQASFSFFCYRMPDYVTDIPIVPAHWHNEMELFYSEAYGTLYINDEAYEVAPGDIFFINPKQIHRTYRKTHGMMCHIVFDLNILKTTIAGNPVNALIDDIIGQKMKISTRAERGGTLYRELLPTVRSIMESQEMTIPFGYESCRITSCLFAVLAACYRADCFEIIDENNLYGMHYVAEVMDYIQLKFRDSLTVSDLARKMNISETYIYRLFRDYVGCTPVNYINSIRLREAYRMLDEGMNVTETAAAVGIPNVSYFIKLFKSATGQTPLNWLKNKKDGL